MLAPVRARALNPLIAYEESAGWESRPSALPRCMTSRSTSLVCGWPARQRLFRRTGDGRRLKTGAVRKRLCRGRPMALREAIRSLPASLCRHSGCARRACSDAGVSSCSATCAYYLTATRGSTSVRQTGGSTSSPLTVPLFEPTLASEGFTALRHAKQLHA